MDMDKPMDFNPGESAELSSSGVELELKGQKLKHFSSVDLPVLCSNPSTAVRMLGGLDHLIATCRGQSKKLQFYFRPEDELSIPLPSEPKIKTSRLLLRVRVSKGANGDRQVKDTEVLGYVGSGFHFSAIADFQYLTMQTFSPFINNSKNSSTVNSNSDITSPHENYISTKRLEIVPSAFIPKGHPGQYAYHTADAAAIVQQEMAAGRQGVVLRFGNPIPEGPPPDLVNRPRRRSAKYQMVLQKLQALFDRKQGGREMWQRKALETQLERDGMHAFLELLRVVAYNMSNGPWRGLWVKYGYDPAKDPVARYYQVIDVRWKEAELEKLKETYRGACEKITQKENKDLPQDSQELRLFAMPVRRQMVFQLCDLSSTSIQQLLLTLPRKPSCSSNGGWFRIEDLNNLRNRIVQYLGQYVNNCQKTLTLTPEKSRFLTPLEIIDRAEETLNQDVIVPASSKAAPTALAFGGSNKQRGMQKSNKRKVPVDEEAEVDQDDEDVATMQQQEIGEGGGEKGHEQTLRGIQSLFSRSGEVTDVNEGRGRKDAKMKNTDADLSSHFVIPLTPGDLLNASSIQLLGGTRTDNYGDYDSSSSSD